MAHEDTTSTKTHEGEGWGAGRYREPVARARAGVVSGEIIGAAIEVHRQLGPGLAWLWRPATDSTCWSSISFVRPSCSSCLRAPATQTGSGPGAEPKSAPAVLSRCRSEPARLAPRRRLGGRLAGAALLPSLRPHLEDPL